MAYKDEEPCIVLVADPPWSFSDKLPGPSRGAEKNYDVLSQKDIEDFPLPRMGDKAVLFLWRVSSQVEEAYAVVRAWGFVPKTELVWVKKTKNGKRHMGMGRIIRAEHETCIIATRGGLITPFDRGVRSTFETEEGDVFEGPVRRHSQKPEEFFQLVERLYPARDGRHVQLFARVPRPGWECYGNELPEGSVDMRGELDPIIQLVRETERLGLYNGEYGSSTSDRLSDSAGQGGDPIDERDARQPERG